MAKMSTLNIEQTNKMVDYLNQIAQFIDMELIPETEEISTLRGRLVQLQTIIESYLIRIQGE